MEQNSILNGRENDFYPDLVNYLTLVESVNIHRDLKVGIKIDSKQIAFNEIYLGIYKEEEYIKIIKKSFSEKELSKYFINKKNHQNYSTTLLEAWAKEKYNFTMNIK